VLFSALFWGAVACTAHAALRTPPPGDDSQSEGGFVNAFFTQGASAYRQVKDGVEAVGVPSQWFNAADQAWARLSGAV
jgi:hypothetical protein